MHAGEVGESKNCRDEKLAELIRDRPDEIPPSVVWRYEQAMDKLFAIPTNYNGGWPPVLVPHDFVNLLLVTYQMPIGAEAIEAFTDYTESVLAQIAVEQAEDQSRPVRDSQSR